MGRFPTGVTVVAASTREGGPRGLTVNSFTSVSLDPPLVLVCIDKQAGSHDTLLDAGCFAVSVLSEGQSAIADRFANEEAERRFDDLGWVMSEGGNPWLDGAAAWFDCVLDEVFAAGDHSILLGRVQKCVTSDHEPLVFHAGAYRRASDDHA